MTSQTMNAHNQQGSNPDAIKILFGVVLGSVLLGGLWSLLGPGLALVGTWQDYEGGSYDVFRFDADGSYWQNAYGGLLSVSLSGTYEVVDSSAGVYRVRVKTEIGEGQMKFRLESPDRLVAIDVDGSEDQPYTRAGDWVMARRPSSESSSYDGATPHLGCWQRQGVQGPDLELLDEGTLLRYSGGEVERATYSVDYSKLPFHFDVTDAAGQLDREIFDFAAGGALRISQTQLADGARPEEMNQHQSYFPCPESDSRGDA